MRTAHCLMAICTMLYGGLARTETASGDTPRVLANPVSGYAFQAPDTQALQNDDFANPGLLWRDKGGTYWRAAPANGKPACAGCHTSDTRPIAGAAARYPQYHPGEQRVINLEQRINLCRWENQGMAPLAYESDTLLSLTTYVASLSRGQPFQIHIEGPARPFFDAGREYFYTRRGQLNLACHHCHERNVGRMLRGDRLSQGHGNAYPAYRLEWQKIGSLQRRLRFCNTGVRAEPFALGAQQYVNLEFFLAWRAATLPIETPGVRR